MFNFLKNKSGSSIVEFALILLPFLIFIGILIEALFFIYQSIAIEYLNAQAGKYSSSFKNSDQYEAKYNEYLDSKKGNIGFFIRDNDYEAKLTFCKSIQDLANQACQNNQNSKIIIYQLNRPIKPLFLFLSKNKNKQIQSKLVYVGESDK